MEINYSRISWCLLMFEEQLLTHKYRHMKFTSRNQESLFFHFNRDERIERALDYFRNKESTENKIYLEKFKQSKLYKMRAEKYGKLFCK